jgi:hypothetical protein
MDERLTTLAARVSAISPQWAEVVRPTPSGDVTADDTRHPDAIESIREGVLAHDGRSRVLDSATDADLALLIGDWCYASGLRAIAEAGDVDAVQVLAGAIADIATISMSDHAARDERWQTAIQEL